MPDLLDVLACGTLLSRLSADFLINEKGIVEKVHYGAHAADHMDLNEVISVVSSDQDEKAA